MPYRLPTPCATPGCPELSDGRWCDDCRAERERERERDRGTRQQRGYGARWIQRRNRHLKREPYCRACGEDGTQVDHVVPLAEGGEDNDSNLQTLCDTCHRRKTRRDVQRQRGAARAPRLRKGERRRATTRRRVRFQ